MFKPPTISVTSFSLYAQSFGEPLSIKFFPFLTAGVSFFKAYICGCHNFSSYYFGQKYFETQAVH